MRFPEAWAIRPPRPTTVDPSTGNKRPGAKPDPVPVRGLLQQRYPRTEQEQIDKDRTVDTRVLLLHPEILTEAKLGRAPLETDVAIAPDLEVWQIVRDPNVRRPNRGVRAPKYIAVIVRRATDIKET